MGFVRVDVAVNHLSGFGHPYLANFLVDTGASYSVAPASILRKVNIDVEGRKTFELGNGESVEYDYGFARFEVLGEETISTIIFGPEKTEPLLGVIVLGDLGLLVDPKSGLLRRRSKIRLPDEMPSAIKQKNNRQEQVRHLRAPYGS